MRRVFVILVSAVALMRCASGLFGQEPDLMVGAVHDDRDATEITRDYYRRTGAWFIPMKVGTREGFALLGTGSTGSTIHAPAGEADYPELSLLQSGNVASTPIFAAVPLSYLGGPKKSSFVGVTDFSMLREFLVCPFTGLAGIDYFMDKVVRLDPGNGSVSLLDESIVEENFDVELPIAWKKGIPYVECELPILGRCSVVFDTGQSEPLSLDFETAEALKRMGKVKVTHEGMNESVNIATKAKVSVRTQDLMLHWVEFGGVRIEDLPVQIQKENQVGVGMLHNFITTIDFRKGRVRLVRRIGDFTKTCRRHATGMGFCFRAPDDLLISAVVEGRPAKAAGLQIGDRIISLNTKTPIELSRHEINAILGDTSQPVSLQIERNGETLHIEFQTQSPLSLQTNWKADPPEFDPGE